MNGFSATDLSGLKPSEFARLVKRTPNAALTKVMNSDQRGHILDLIFNTLPTLFRPDRAESASAVLHWHITGRPDGGADRYQLAIANRACTVTPLSNPSDKAMDPRLTIIIGGVEFLQLIAGTTNPAMMFMMGKIKAKGDLSLVSSFANLFDMPRS